MRTFRVVTRPAAGTAGERQAVMVERRFASLDGWRGVAIVAVFFYHYGITSHGLGASAAIGWLAGGGWAAVELFFVLSGFLITGILLDTRGHERYFLNFYARRTLRIFPLYYAVLLVILALTPVLHLRWHAGQWMFFAYLGNIAMVADASLIYVKPWFTFDHLWSLAVEEQFYLLWPLVVLLTPTRRRLIWLALAGIAAGLLLRTGLLFVINPSDAIEWSYHTLPMRCDGLLFGAIAAILLRSRSLHGASRAFTWPAWVAGLGTALIVLYDRSLTFHAPLPDVLLHPCLAVLFAKLILRSLEPGTLPNRIGSLRILRFLGKYSYGLYVFHLLVDMAPLLRLLQRTTHSIPVGGMLYVVLAFILSLTAAVLSYELFERHFLKLKSRFSYSARPAHVPGD